MKKYFLLLFALSTLSLTSCSSDDDNDTKENSIVATWTLESMSPPVFDMSCEQDPQISFSDDGTMTWTLYDSQNNCSSSTDSGTWMKNSETSYTVTLPNYGPVDGTVSFDDPDNFTFNTELIYNGMTVPVTLNFTK